MISRRPHMLAVLEKVRESIRRRDHRYICDAVKWAAYAGSQSEYFAASCLSDRIQRSLGSHNTAEEWLRCVHNVPVKQLTYENMREYRLRWLDTLIKEYS